MSSPSRRIPLAPVDQLDAEQLEVVGGPESPMLTLNLTLTMLRHPALLRSWTPFATHLGMQSLLPPQDREVLILRVIGLTGEVYEAAHHRIIARDIGFSEEEIEAARTGADSLPPFRKTLAAAAEELVRNQRLSDATWATLAEKYDTRQMMEVVFAVGMYSLMAMATNSFDIQPEEDIESCFKPVLT